MSLHTGQQWRTTLKVNIAARRESELMVNFTTRRNVKLTMERRVSDEWSMLATTWKVIVDVSSKAAARFLILGRDCTDRASVSQSVSAWVREGEGGMRRLQRLTSIDVISRYSQFARLTFASLHPPVHAALSTTAAWPAWLLLLLLLGWWRW